MKKLLSLLLGLCLMGCSAALAQELPQEDYYGRYMAAQTEEERQAVLSEMPDTLYAAYDREEMKWGLINRVGQWVVQPQWDWMDTLAHGDYALAATIMDEEILAYSIIDRAGNTVATIDTETSDAEFSYTNTSDGLLVTQWLDNRMLLFSATAGRFLNDRGFIYGDETDGYSVHIIDDPSWYDMPDIYYLLSPTGQRMDDGVWMQPLMNHAVPATQPDAQPMRLVSWNDADWQLLMDEYPEIADFCGDDLSFVANRQNGYHLLDETGTIVFSSENLEDFILLSPTTNGQQRTNCSEEGLSWDTSADSATLTDAAGNTYYTMWYDEVDVDSLWLTPQDNVFLCWDDESLYGYLNGDGSILYPPCFDEADLFVDGLAQVSWFDDNWTEEELILYTDCEDSGPYHYALNPSARCFAYIDKFGNVVFSSFGIYHLP